MGILGLSAQELGTPLYLAYLFVKSALAAWAATLLLVATLLMVADRRLRAGRRPGRNRDQG